MIDSSVVRVGFVTQLLWGRFGPLWSRLVSDVGAEVVLPSSEASEVPPGQLDQVPGLAFRLAVGQALSLGDCDLLIVPDLNPGPDSPRGGGQDPWVASFPEVLVRTVGGLPPVVAVPAGTGEDLEGLAIETLFRLSRDAAMVRRSWQRHHGAARTAAPREPRWPAAAPGVRTVALVCQPWLSSDALTAAAVDGEAGRVRTLALHAFDPVALRSEGERLDEKLIATDLEVLGAARLFARRAGVDEVKMVIDRESGSDAWLSRRVEAVTRKPFSVVALQDLPEPETLIAPELER